jgi:hypothetical protein
MPKSGSSYAFAVMWVGVSTFYSSCVKRKLALRQDPALTKSRRSQIPDQQACYVVHKRHLGSISSGMNPFVVIDSHHHALA